MSRYGNYKSTLQIITELYRIKYDGESYVIQKLIEVENKRNFWQKLTKKRESRKEWRSLDKQGMECRFGLRGFIWPEYYKEKEICISLIEKWATPNTYFYPPDYSRGRV